MFSFFSRPASEPMVNKKETLPATGTRNKGKKTGVHERGGVPKWDLWELQRRGRDPGASQSRRTLRDTVRATALKGTTCVLSPTALAFVTRCSWTQLQRRRNFVPLSVQHTKQYYTLMGAKDTSLFYS